MTPPSTPPHRRPHARRPQPPPSRSPQPPAAATTPPREGQTGRPVCPRTPLRSCPSPNPQHSSKGYAAEGAAAPHSAVRAHAVTVAGAAAAVDASTRNQLSHRPHKLRGRRAGVQGAAESSLTSHTLSSRPRLSPPPSHLPDRPQYPTAYTSPTPYRARISSIVPAAGGGPASAAAAAACPCANVDATRPGVPARKRHHSPPA